MGVRGFTPGKIFASHALQIAGNDTTPSYYGKTKQNTSPKTLHCHYFLFDYVVVKHLREIMKVISSQPKRILVNQARRQLNWNGGGHG